MARSTCPKCDNTTFEMVENSPRRSKYKLEFIQCAACGAVVGVMDYLNIGAKLEEMEKKIGSNSSVTSSLNVIHQNIIGMHENIRRLFNLINSKVQPPNSPRSDISES